MWKVSPESRISQTYNSWDDRQPSRRGEGTRETKKIEVVLPRTWHRLLQWCLLREACSVLWQWRRWHRGLSGRAGAQAIAAHEDCKERPEIWDLGGRGQKRVRRLPLIWVLSTVRVVSVSVVLCCSVSVTHSQPRSEYYVENSRNKQLASLKFHTAAWRHLVSSHRGPPELQMTPVYPCSVS